VPPRREWRVYLHYVCSSPCYPSPKSVPLGPETQRRSLWGRLDLRYVADWGYVRCNTEPDPELARYCTVLHWVRTSQARWALRIKEQTTHVSPHVEDLSGETGETGLHFHVACLLLHTVASGSGLWPAWRAYTVGSSAHVYLQYKRRGRGRREQHVGVSCLDVSGSRPSAAGCVSLAS